MTTNLLSLSGRARVGKGTFVTLLRDILHPQIVSEKAFATELKAQIDPFLRSEYGISAFTTDTEEKKIIRPHLVALGAGMRAQDPGYWIKLVEPQVKLDLARGDVVVVSDSRYRNECDWVHSLGGQVIYIERLQPDGKPVPPANEEEAANDDAARAVSDFTISWPTFEANYLYHMRPFVLDVWTQMIRQPTL